MRKGILVGLILMACFYESNAQYGGGFGRSRDRDRDYRRKRMEELQSFKPTLDVSVGYGFPNLDKYLLTDFYNYYSGSGTQSGPIIASVDYHFAPRMAIGVMVNYGKISRPYYSYNSGEQAFTGSLTNTAVMLNFTRYMGMSQKIMPYTRTAIGINTGQSKYLTSDGSKVTDTDDQTSLAYQVGLGVEFNVVKHGGFFVEAGYGKYIIAAGLKMKF
jgi:opacity protein-like surface antigen